MQYQEGTISIDKKLGKGLLDLFPPFDSNSKSLEPTTGRFRNLLGRARICFLALALNGFNFILGP